MTAALFVVLLGFVLTVAAVGTHVRPDMQTLTAAPTRHLRTPAPALLSAPRPGGALPPRLSLASASAPSAPSSGAREVGLLPSVPVLAWMALGGTAGALAAVWQGRRPAPRAAAWTVAATGAAPEAAEAEPAKVGPEAALERGKQLVRKALQDHKVILFMKGVPKAPQCGFSAGVVEILNKYPDTKWVACNVLQDQAVREAVKAVGDWPTIPQLYVSGELIGGFDIVNDLHTKGELTDILRGPQ